MSSDTTATITDGALRARIRVRIQRAGVAMLITGRDTHYAGRPMLPLLLDDDPQIYFLTHRHSKKVTELALRPQVVITLSLDECHIVILGVADVSRNAALIRRLWRPSYRAWFPSGATDADAAVVAVTIDRVNFWEPPRSRLTRVFQAIKAIVTGRPVDTPMRTIDGL